MSLESFSALATAITSIVAIILAVSTFWYQTRQSNMALGITILRDCERDFFYSAEMRRRRYEAAHFLINRPADTEPPQACYELLDFFDAFGIYVNRRFIDAELAWTVFYYWFSIYWHCLAKDVDELHQYAHGVPYLSNCQTLYSRLTAYATRYKRLPSDGLRFTPDRLRTFFQNELDACRDAAISIAPPEIRNA